MYKCLMMILALVLLTSLKAQTSAEQKKKLFRDLIDYGIGSDASADSYQRIYLKGNNMCLSPYANKDSLALQEISLPDIDTASFKWQYKSTNDTLPANWLLTMAAHPNKFAAVSYFANGKKQKTKTVTLFLAPSLEENSRNRIVQLFKVFMKAYQRD